MKIKEAIRTLIEQLKASSTGEALVSLHEDGFPPDGEIFDCSPSHLVVKDPSQIEREIRRYVWDVRTAVAETGRGGGIWAKTEGSETTVGIAVVEVPNG